jgi:hypothetical protein
MFPFQKKRSDRILRCNKMELAVRLTMTKFISISAAGDYLLSLGALIYNNCITKHILFDLI